MKAINSNHVLVEKLPKEEYEGFQSVQIQDDFIYKARVKQIPMQTVYVDNHALQVGDTVVFAQYDPDSFMFEGDKFIKVSEILAVL